MWMSLEGHVAPSPPPRQLSLAAGPLSLASLFQEAPSVFLCSSPTQRPPQKLPRGWARTEAPPSLPPALSGHQVPLAELFLGKVGPGVGPWRLVLAEKGLLALRPAPSSGTASPLAPLQPGALLVLRSLLVALLPA